MKKLVFLHIIEDFPVYDKPCESKVYIETEELDNLEKRIMDAWYEWLKKENPNPEVRELQEIIDEAKEEGIYFGNSMMDLPEELQKKYNFKFVEPFDAIIEADFDNGIGWG